jgi:predicted branched-subunit amino acid permease
MAWALLESLLVTGVLTLLSAILPSNWFRDGFAYKGFIFIAIATIAAIIFQRSLKGILPPPQIQALYWLVPLVFIVVIIGAVQTRPRLRNILLSVADRISIMLFLYIPVGLLSLMVVTLRNLL